MAKKSSNLEKETRLRVIMEWVLQEHSFADIIRSAVNKWGISSRQAERYYSDAYKLFSEGTTHNIEHKIAYHISRKKKLIRDMDPLEKRSATGARAINKILDSIAQLEGLMIKKHEHTGKDGGPIETTTKLDVDLSKLSTEQLKALRAFKNTLKE